MTGAAASPIRALARLHWRFLLPAAPAGVRRRCALPGADPALVELARAAGLAERVEGVLGGSTGWDLVGRLDGSAVSLEEASDGVAPDGVLYVEERRRPGLLVGPRLGGLRRRLSRAGLELWGAWAALPDFRSPFALVPLDRPAAFRWFVDTRLSVHSPERRLLGAALSALVRGTPEAVTGLPPSVAFIAVRRSSMSAPPLLSPSRLRPGARGGADAGRDGGATRPLLLGPGSDRAILLPFGAGDPEPGVVVKVPVLPAFNQRTRNEQELVREIRDSLPPTLREAVPEPLGVVPVGELGVGLETHLTGVSMARRAGRWGGRLGPKVSDLRLAIGWLGAFHVAVRPAPGEEEDHGAPLRRLAAVFGADGAEATLVGMAAARLEALPPLPRVWQHRDYNIWNLLRDGEALRVLDWEGVRPGPALSDALHLVTHWHESVRHLRTESAQLEGLDALFLDPRPRHPATSAARAAVREYLDTLGLEPAYVPPVLVVLWCELALRRRTQQRDSGHPDPDPRADNRNLPFLARLAERAGDLFDTAGPWT